MSEFAASSCDGIVISAPGGPEVLRWIENMPLAAPGPDELLIHVFFAGVNRHDCNQRRRGPTPAHSDVPGLEVSGIVQAAGSRVRGFTAGDAVCALVDGGGYATRAIVPAELAFRVEAPLDLQSAAALPEALFTVWHNFFGVADLGPGESVLIHGGTSGVGSLAIQMLGALGHPVHVTCGSDEKCAAALALGARTAINYRTHDFEQEIQRVTRHAGVDVILDMAGSAHCASNVDALARRGRLVHLSPGDGAEFRAPLRAIMAKEVRITGSLLRPLPLAEKSLIAQQLRRVAMPLVRDRRIRPWVQETYPLRMAAEAQARLESGQSMGKIVLEARAGSDASAHDGASSAVQRSAWRHQ
ncbi:putative NAD(P)H quinone oxidoreductase, PIG3 family [Variovorax sp. HW608]|nr:NAD(P)H-quinone oxidoreductase [Variovorax sp. HW608]SCK55356.1 putative NAD(P)H quinone oxidoreductase, PIG3 family [Variovorax sp. HW608]